ncbi:hypothetical protein ASPVEDRAFT_88831 [Aspergillus versicolor CBS 583.65]|uniref:Kinesin-like protein n=1 Tax=Aspergillus versicolor CBS 583.65 TaxID=1036611 RepID=A0A1L9Q1E5_ASPVE|nr:uncharacterized protein ASPVEDRAFT_88831 [Aspergillus versicolor CBS 583.65]OJJ07593.1 hypothetical protein ASPVEDRAFT_88831 [Aspergillus versicolor CBS 583.65]
MEASNVFVRWRPVPPTQPNTPEINKVHSELQNSRVSISISLPSPGDSSWKSGHVFNQVFEPTDGNRAVFDAVVAPILPKVLNGDSCSFFAYGHSGSGKSHTILGYDFEDPDNFGLCLAAARYLCEELKGFNTGIVREGHSHSSMSELGIGLRMYELRGNAAFDLLNNHCKCNIRQGYDGQTHIRGETEVLDGGRVRVRPIVTKACWSFEDFRQELLRGLQLRASGVSTVHEESSRTHAVLELEIVNRALLDAREAVVERQSELVPVAKRATDVYIEEQMKGLVRTGDGKFVPNPEYQIDHRRIDEAEEKKAEFEKYVSDAEEHVHCVFRSSGQTCLGGKLVFVDLAGAEYYHGSSLSTHGSRSLPSPQEQKEGRQINTDLLALKEVIRARASKQSRIPYRSSPLTMVLRGHFEATGSRDSYSAVILTASPAADQYAATANTLKYGNLVGTSKNR